MLQKKSVRHLFELYVEWNDASNVLDPNTTLRMRPLPTHITRDATAVHLFRKSLPSDGGDTSNHQINITLSIRERSTRSAQESYGRPLPLIHYGASSRLTLLGLVGQIWLLGWILSYVLRAYFCILLSLLLLLETGTHDNMQNKWPSLVP